MGTPEITTDRLSELSARAEDMVSEIAVSSLPEVSATVRLGVSATALTVTSMVSTVEAVSEPSVEVEVTVRLKSALSLLGGVMVRPVSWAVVKVQLPSPLSLPAESVAPVGTPEITTDRLSELSLRAEDIVSEIAASSLPEVSATVRLAVSATPETETLTVPTLWLLSLPSVDVAVTVRAKSALSSLGGVMLRPVNWADVSVQLPSPLSLPAESEAPVGTPEITTERLSELSETADDRSSEIAASSLPLLSATDRLGVSATAVTVTSRVSELVAEVLPSLAVAVTVSEKLLLSSLAGVMVRPVSWPELRVQLPSPLSLPAESTAPVGTPDITTLRSSPSTRAEEMFRVMAASSSPLAAEALRSGAETSGVTTSTVASSTVASSEVASSDVVLLLEALGLTLATVLVLASVLALALLLSLAELEAALPVLPALSEAGLVVSVVLSCTVSTTVSVTVSTVSAATSASAAASSAASSATASSTAASSTAASSAASSAAASLDELPLVLSVLPLLLVLPSRASAPCAAAPDAAPAAAAPACAAADVPAVTPAAACAAAGPVRLRTRSTWPSWARASISSSVKLMVSSLSPFSVTSTFRVNASAA